MREFVKSFVDFSWGLVVYGLSQGGQLLRDWPTSAPIQGAAQSFQKVNVAIQGQFDTIDNAIFKPVQSAQNALIDVTFNFFSSENLNPRTVLHTGENLLKWGAGVAAQLIPGGTIGTGGPPVGWGPVNRKDAELFYVAKDGSTTSNQ